MLELLNISIICVDCINYEKARNAFYKSIKDIKFGDMIFFSDINIEGPFRNINIDKIRSKEEYSEFIFKKLNNYINTDFVLIIQFDGYILHPKSWVNEFLDFDYIGAKWWYTDNLNVGNGGFSLRSKKLLEELSKEEYNQVHPEDHTICRLYGQTLKDKGFKFATEEIADKFSFEHNHPGQMKTFGFHGWPDLIL